MLFDDGTEGRADAGMNSLTSGLNRATINTIIYVEDRNGNS